MKYEVTIKVEATGTFTDQDVQDFIESELGYGAGMSQDNPFVNEDADAKLEIQDIDVTPDYYGNEND